MSDGMRRELVYLSSYATNRYFIPNWGTIYKFILFSVTIYLYLIYIMAAYSAILNYLKMLGGR